MLNMNFLYSKSSHLFSIGFNVRSIRVTRPVMTFLLQKRGCASYVAIAQGKIPQENWFAMGRLLQNPGIRFLFPGRVNFWIPYASSGYAELWRYSFKQDLQIAVIHQIRIRWKKWYPLGHFWIGYNILDANMAYQYHSFGVPDIGFKRGLSEDIVSAPYASMMALMIEPGKAYDNILRLASLGWKGIRILWICWFYSFKACPWWNFRHY